MGSGIGPVWYRLGGEAGAGNKKAAGGGGLCGAEGVKLRYGEEVISREEAISSRGWRRPVGWR